MLLWLAQFFQDEIGPLRVFNFITFRAMFATMTALAIGLIAGPAVIRMLARLKVGQAVRQDGPQTHLIKNGTPTMGGVLVLIAIGVSTLNPMLTFAAIVLGAVCAFERRATGGVLAPILTHMVWGLIMVLVLPPVFGV